MITRQQLIVDATVAVDTTMAARPAHQIATTGTHVAAAMPVIVAAVLDEVRRACVRSMTPAQIREVCDQIRNQPHHYQETAVKLQIDNPAAFATAVAWVARHIAARPTIAVLASIRITAGDDGALTLAAYDYDVLGVIDPCPGVTVTEPGTAVVPGALLNQLAAGMRPTRIEADDRTMLLSAGRTKAQVQVMDGRSLPDLPGLPAMTVEVCGADMAASVQQLAPMCSDPTAWAPGAGIHLDTTDGEIRLTASDRYRIGRHVLGVDGELAHPHTVPIGPLQAAVKGWTREEAYLGADESSITVQQQERISQIRCIAEPYPRLDGTLAKQHPERLTVDAAKLRDAVKQAGQVAPAVSLTVTADQVQVQADNSGTQQRQADWQTVLPCEATADARLLFNPTYLADGITAADTPTVTVAFTAGARPVRINPDSARTVALMAMRGLDQ